MYRLLVYLVQSPYGPTMSTPIPRKWRSTLSSPHHTICSGGCDEEVSKFKTCAREPNTHTKK